MSATLATPPRAGPGGAGAAASHVDGLLALRLRRDPAGRTVIAARRQRFPLRTTVAFHLDERDPGMAFVYVQNPTGGVFESDRLTVDVVAEAGTRLHLTGQSATKLCRSEHGAFGTQELRLDVGEGAYVEHVPDALIPHAGARYRQRTAVELAPGGLFVGAETIAPGRAWERFAYHELDLRTVVRTGGRELCLDALRLAPGALRDPGCAGVLGAHHWLVTLLAVAPDHDGEALAAHIDTGLAAHGDVLAAAGPLPDGCGTVVRILAHRAPAARRALLHAWSDVRAALVGLPLPPLRK